MKTIIGLIISAIAVLSAITFNETGSPKPPVIPSTTTTFVPQTVVTVPPQITLPPPTVKLPQSTTTTTRPKPTTTTTRYIPTYPCSDGKGGYIPVPYDMSQPNVAPICPLTTTTTANYALQEWNRICQPAIDTNNWNQYNNAGCSGYASQLGKSSPKWDFGITTTTTTTYPSGISDGKYLVGSEITPGTYESIEIDPHDGCYAERASKTGIIWNKFQYGGKVTVVIVSTDYMFYSNGCSSWKKIK